MEEQFALEYPRDEATMPGLWECPGTISNTLLLGYSFEAANSSASWFICSGVTAWS